MLEQIYGAHARLAIARSDAQEVASKEGSARQIQRVVAASLMMVCLINSPLADAGIIDWMKRGGAVAQAFVNFLMYLFYVLAAALLGWSIYGFTQIASRNSNFEKGHVVMAFFCSPLLAAVGLILDGVLSDLTGQTSAGAQNHATFSN